jgi:branched-chain amino acid transport system substrate-binding protein
MFDALTRSLATGSKPGTPEFRVAMRDALVTTKNVVGTHAVYNYTPGERYGADDRARVLVTLRNGKWELLK